MRLYNALTRQVEEVKPADGSTVKIYSCGPTVYRYAHIGNMRTFMLGDLIRRALRFEGQRVVQVMNVTDVGHMTDDVSQESRDRMDIAVADEGLSPQEIAAKYTKAFLEDEAAVNIEPADHYPKATDHIPEMIELTAKLIERGLAYEVGGNVYFDVHAFPDYGRLSGNTLEQLRAGHRQELEVDPNKRHAEDFALWKHAHENRLMRWPSPWGDGFPGWHIECSAMSMKLLGDRFDVHTGGNDLRFPHHEDERAQSNGVAGREVVSTWVYGGFLQQDHEKMAKSKGNVTRVTDVSAQGYDPLAFRLLCFGVRYRNEMDFTWEALDGAQTRLRRLRQRLAEWSTAERASQLSPGAAELDRRFRDAVADDLDMPKAMEVLSEAVAADIPDGDKFALLSSWDAVLGLDLERAVREGAGGLPDDVQALVAERDAARRVRDFARSDEIRDRLTSMGYEVMDTPEGTRVRPS
ncbi:MAG TPA: cysteine--tRNA ligase [Actinomycetota bacterium]|nr:cysteine--tRNA ligase [Actinomycetota bacterium]